MRSTYRGPMETVPALPSRRLSRRLLRGRTSDPLAGAATGQAATDKLWPSPVAKDDCDSVTPRRRRSQPGRRRRRHRLLGWLKSIAWLLAIVGSPVAVVLWLYHSPRFALREIAVTLVAEEMTAAGPGDGPSASGWVPEVWVRQAVATFEGRNLLRLSLAEVSGRLEVHPWVQSVGLSKELPSRLGVRIIERREAALLRDGGDLFYIDRDGEIIAPVEGTQPHLVAVELAGPWPHPGPALALLRELETAGPEWLGGLESILVLEESDFVLSTTDLPYPLLMRAGSVADKIRDLRALLPVIMAHTGAGAAIDLRFDQRIIIQPSAGRSAAGSVLAARIAGTASGRNS